MKRRRIILIVLAILVIAVVVICLVQPVEPSYEGRKLSEWIDDLERVRLSGHAGGPWDIADPEATGTTAAHAITAIGSNAVPTLLRWLQAEKSPMKMRLNALLDKQSHISFRFKTADALNELAWIGFDILKTNALSARPSLIKLLHSANGNLRSRALGCLITIDDNKERMLPVILELQHGSDTNLQAVAAWWLHYVYDNKVESVSPAKTADARPPELHQ